MQPSYLSIQLEFLRSFEWCLTWCKTIQWPYMHRSHVSRLGSDLDQMTSKLNSFRACCCKHKSKIKNPPRNLIGHLIKFINLFQSEGNELITALVWSTGQGTIWCLAFKMCFDNAFVDFSQTKQDLCIHIYYRMSHLGYVFETWRRRRRRRRRNPLQNFRSCE
jgi:hypothetical protein